MTIETKPPVNADLTLDGAVDQLKYLFFDISAKLAGLHYSLAHLAGTGNLDLETNWDMQHELVDMYEDLYVSTASFVRDDEKDTIDRPPVEEYYSDGRNIVQKFDAPDGEEAAWPHNRFCLGDGGPAELPRTTRFWLRAPWDHTVVCPNIEDLPMAMTYGGRSRPSGRLFRPRPLQGPNVIAGPSDYVRRLNEVRQATEEFGGRE